MHFVSKCLILPERLFFAMTVSANTIQLDDITLSLPNTGDREITKTQVKGYKVWIAALEASFNEAMKSEKGSKEESDPKEESEKSESL